MCFMYRPSDIDKMDKNRMGRIQYNYLQTYDKPSTRQISPFSARAAARSTSWVEPWLGLRRIPISRSSSGGSTAARSTTPAKTSSSRITRSSGSQSCPSSTPTTTGRNATPSKLIRWEICSGLKVCPFALFSFKSSTYVGWIIVHAEPHFITRRRSFSSYSLLAS